MQQPQFQLWNQQPRLNTQELEQYIQKWAGSVKYQYAAVEWNADPKAEPRFSIKDPPEIQKQLEQLRQHSEQFALQCITYQRLHPKDPSWGPGGPANPTRPPNIDVRRWHQAEYANPDKARCMPVQIEGFEFLRRRMLIQHEMSSSQINKIANMHTEVEEMHKENCNLGKKLLDTRKEIQASAEKVLKLYHLLDKQSRIRRCTSVETDSAQAQETLQRIAQLDYEVHKPHWRGSLDEADAAIALFEEPSISGARLDLTSQRELLAILSTMDNGLMELRKVVNKNMHHLDIMREFHEGM